MPGEHRRRLLRRIGTTVTTGLLAGLAGCSETVRIEVGEDDESTRTLRPTDQPTRTPSPTPTPTAVDTMTATATAAPTVTDSAPPAAADTELVARYPFDSHVRDVLGGADLSGAEPAYVDGPEGSAAASWNEQFAVSSELYAPTTEDALTFAFWLRDDGTQSTWDDDLLWRLTSANSEQIGAFCTTAGDVFIFTAGEGNDNNTLGMSDTSVLDGAWHHVAFVYDQPLDRMALYVDGVQEFDVEYTDKVPGMEDVRLVFGNNRADGYKGYDGALDDFRYYADSLTETAVQSLYQLGNPETTATETATPATASETPTATATDSPTPTPTGNESVGAGLVPATGSKPK